MFWYKDAITKRVSSQHDRIEVVSRENQKWIANGQQPASCDSCRGLRVGLRRWRKRSHRRIHDLVAHTAFKGLDANEIGCVRISMMARSNTLRSTGRIQMRETSNLLIDQIQLATHGRSIQMCHELSHSNSDDLTTCALCACDHTGLRSNSCRSAA